MTFRSRGAGSPLPDDLQRHHHESTANPEQAPASPPIAPIAASVARGEAPDLPVCGPANRGSRDRRPTYRFTTSSFVQEVSARALEAILAEHEHVSPLGVTQRLARVLLDHEDGHVRGA